MGTMHRGRGLAIRALLSAALLAGMVVAVPAAAPGCEPPPTPFNMTVIGHSGGAFSSIEATGDYVLAVQGTALVSYDVGSGVPVAAGFASAPEPGCSLFLDGARAYVVGVNTFGIYDITDPASPRLLATADMPSPEYEIVGFFAAGDYAYAGYEKYGSFGTKIFDVADPATASVIAYSGLIFTDRTPDVVGGYAYATAADGQVDLIDLADATDPSIGFSFGSNVSDAAVANGYLFASRGSGAGGVMVYDLANPAIPAYAGATSGTLGGSVAAVNDRLWRVTSDAVELWTTAVKTAPALVDTDAATGAFQLASADTALAFAISEPDAEGATSMYCFETESVPNMDTLASTLTSDAGDNAAAIVGETAYIASPAGLRILDLGSAGLPLLGSLDMPAEPLDLAVSGTTAVFATDAGIRVADVTDPASPAARDDVAVTGGLYRVAIDGDVAYGVGAVGLYAFDVSDPANVTVLDSVGVTSATDLDARDGRVWVTQSDGDSGGTVYEYDATDPSSLIRSAEHYIPGGMPSVTVTTETAFVGLSNSAVKTFDISEPGTLYYTNWIDVGSELVADVSAKDGILLTAGGAGVQQTGVYEPTMPYQMGFSPTAGDRVAGDGDLIAVSSAGGGTTFLRYDPVSFRTFGGTRFETAIAMSQTFDSSEYVVLATGRSYPDALAGVPLAYALNAPILLTERDYIPDDVAEEIERLGATKAIVLGGVSAVSPNIVAQLESMGLASGAIERISGATRYETARAIALRLQQVLGAGSIDKAFIATGLNFPDALAAAGAAAKAGCPILLVKPGDSNTAALAAIASLGIDDTVIVGGPGVVPNDVAAKFPSPERVAGANRYETAVELAQWSMADPDASFAASNLFVVTGTNFPDALSSGVVAAGSDAPTLLVGSDPPPETLGFIRDNADDIDRVDIVGGDAAVSAAVEHWIVTYVK